MIKHHVNTMNQIVNLMLQIKSDMITIFYHKDTCTFDRYPMSEIEMKTLSPDAKIPFHDSNNFRFLTYKEIDHEEIMRFYVREYIEDKETRKVLFGILSRHKFIDDFVNKLHELELYDDFINACGDFYVQIFREWAEKNGLDFT